MAEERMIGIRLTTLADGVLDIEVGKGKKINQMLADEGLPRVGGDTTVNVYHKENGGQFELVTDPNKELRGGDEVLLQRIPGKQADPVTGEVRLDQGKIVLTFGGKTKEVTLSPGTKARLVEAAREIQKPTKRLVSVNRLYATGGTCIGFLATPPMQLGDQWRVHVVWGTGHCLDSLRDPLTGMVDLQKAVENGLFTKRTADKIEGATEE